jgi:glycerol-3-phosphate dehydrogenase
MLAGSTERTNLEDERFDVVVIGAGINGAAIARECARGRKRVLLVEKNDFASGTTSRSTRIIHGGLRYLEHGELTLVRESLRERERLLRSKSHLIRPLNFLLAMPEGSNRSALEVRFGLWLYRKFARRSAANGVVEDRVRLERLLDKGHKWSIFAYEDAQCEYPERLVIEWTLAAASLGAVVRNHTELLKVECSDGEVTGVRLRDLLTGSEFRVATDRVINATGPWADFVLRSSNIPTDEPLVGGVRGSHIVLPLFDGAPKAAVYTEAVDGRPIFIIPWAGQLLVGTTEVKDNNNPDRVAPNGEEIAYLLQSFRRLFPSINYSLSDIRSAFAGVRPLPFITEQSPNSITRRHFLTDHKDDGASGMISVIGGKLTTAASLARECARAIGINVPEPKGFAIRDTLTYQDPGLDQLAASVHVGIDSLRTIASTFNGAAATIFSLVAKDESFRHTLCPHTHHLVAEAVYAVTNEHAHTLADILLRRVPVALGPCWSVDCARTAAHCIGKALGWNHQKIGAELAAFEEEFGTFMVKPGATAKA